MRGNNDVNLLEAKNERENAFQKVINPYIKKGHNVRKSQSIEQKIYFQEKRRIANYDSFVITKEEIDKLSKIKSNIKHIPIKENRESDLENEHEISNKQNKKIFNLNSDTEEKIKNTRNYYNNSGNDKKEKHTDLVSLKSNNTKYRNKKKKKKKKKKKVKRDSFNEVESQIAELKKKKAHRENIFRRESNFCLQKEMGKPINEKHIGIANGENPYVEDFQKSALADKARLETNRKLVYTRFPAFETHEKIKTYNEKISMLTIENKKLQTYKQMVENRFIEENFMFEKNFEKYEIAIANALRLGYSSLYLCNLCEKFILKHKRFFVKKLLQLRQEQKEKIISKWTEQKILDDMKMKNLTVNMYTLYINNMKAIVFVLVNIIKKKISFFFHSLLYNTLKPCCLENGNLGNKQTPHKSALEKSETHNVPSNYLKQSISLNQMIVNIRKYELQIVAYAFARLRNKYADNDVDRYSNSYFVSGSESEHSSSYSIDKNNMNKIKEIKTEKEKNEKKKSSHTKTEIKYTAFNAEEEEEEEVKKKIEQFQLSNHILNNKKMQNFSYDNGNISFYSNDDNTSDSSVYIPHPTEVYNYLCYQEALKMNIKQQKESKENRSYDYYDLANNVAYCENPYLTTGEKIVFKKDDFKNKMQIKGLTDEHSNYDLSYDFVKEKLSQYNKLIRNSKELSYFDIRNLPYASQSMSEERKTETKGQIHLQTNKHDNKNAYLLLTNAKKHMKDGLTKEPVIEKGTDQIDNTKTNTHIVKKVQNRVSFMLNKKDEEAKKFRKQSKNSKTKVNDEEEDLEIHKYSGEKIQKDIPYEFIKTELTDMISSLKSAPNDVHNHVKEINNGLNKIRKKNFVCLIGDGPPNSVNWNDKHVRNIVKNTKIEKSYSCDIKIENKPFNRSTSKILFTLKKKDSKAM